MFVFKALLSCLLYSLMKIRFILQVLETFVCYSEIWSVIYMEVAARIGIPVNLFASIRFFLQQSYFSDAGIVLKELFLKKDLTLIHVLGVQSGT